MESYESTTRQMRSEQPGLCALVQDTLPFYMDGDVSPESRAFISDHLQTCELCSHFLAGARSAQSHLRRDIGSRGRVVEQDWRANAAIARGQRRLLVRVLAFSGMMFVLLFGAFFFSARSSMPRSDTVEQPFAVPTVIPTVSMPNMGASDGVAPTPTPDVLVAPSFGSTPTPVPAR